MRKAVVLLTLISVTPLWAHTVNLSWTASTDAAANPSLTYNVYRSTSGCPASGVPTGATKIASGLSTTSFADTSVQVGTNCYYVTAVLFGAESAGSNTAPGVVLPAAPTNLVVPSAN